MTESPGFEFWGLSAVFGVPSYRELLLKKRVNAVHSASVGPPINIEIASFCTISEPFVVSLGAWNLHSFFNHIVVAHEYVVLGGLQFLSDRQFCSADLQDTLLQFFCRRLFRLRSIGTYVDVIVGFTVGKQGVFAVDIWGQEHGKADSD